MALDAAVHPQDYSMGYFCKDFFTLGGGVGGGLGHGSFDLQEQKGFVKLLGHGMMEHCADGVNWAEYTSSPSVLQHTKEWDPNSSPEACAGEYKVPFFEGSSMTATMMKEPQAAAAAVPAAAGKRKRQRTRTCKNKEELENQRMTHIAVERNRRKQMNDYLAVIRSLMPSSYVQRGDQASIIGGAINFVKELEQHLQSLEAQKMTTDSTINGENGVLLPPIFADFFTFPQYSSTRSPSPSLSPSSAQSSSSKPVTSTRPEGNAANKNNKRTALADIEVSMAESHANLKILSKKRPRQLLKLVSGLQCMWFTILHLNVTTTFDQRVLYSMSVKVEEGCQLTTVDEIADAVNHLLGRIEEEAV